MIGVHERGPWTRSIFSWTRSMEGVHGPGVHVLYFPPSSARLFTVILPRKNAKDPKDGGRFPKRLSLQCESLLVGSVGGRFRTQQQPCRLKRITFCGRYLCFSFTCMIRDSGVLPSELHRGKKCGC